jgi:hypothetical protein
MRRLLSVFALALVLGTASGKAFASSGDNSCVISTVGFANESWGHALWLVCTSGNVYYAYLSNPNTACTPVSMDDVKLYQATAMAAKLSGKTVQITYNQTSCNSGSYKLLVSLNVLQ